MKTFVFLFVIMAFIPKTVLAQEKEKNLKEQKDLKISVGVKTWFNTWGHLDSQLWKTSADATSLTTNSFTTNRTKGDNFVLSMGLSASVIYKKYFGGISFLKPTSKYKFEFDDYTADRYDIDSMLGYYLFRWLGGFVGYKYSKLEITGTAASGDLENISVNLKGPVIGIIVNYPDFRTIVPFLNLGLYFLTSDASTGIKRSIDGPAIELGIALNMKENYLISFGYKGQMFRVRAEEYKDPEDFHGTFLSLNYTF